MCACVCVLVNSYTGEAGVRQLERALAAVCRSTAVKVGPSSERREGSEGWGLLVISMYML